MAIPKEKASSQDENNDRLFGNIQSSKIIEDASNIVKRAARILEENVAEGILAAQEIEKKLVDVSELRATRESNIMKRFRKDAHEALDIFFDALAMATKSLNDITEKANSINKQENGTPNGNGTSNGKNGSITVLEAAFSKKTGRVVNIPMLLDNDSREEEIRIELMGYPLISREGAQIPGANIRFSPKVLILGPGKKEQVVIEVDIPDAAPPGIYSGLVQEKNRSYLKAMLMLEISE